MPDQFQSQDFTEKQLKWSYWFVTHKLLLKKIFNYVVIVVNIIFGFYIIFSVLDNFVIKYNRQKTIVSELILVPQSISNVSQGSTLIISQLQYGSSSVIRSTSRYDIITPINNPNLKHMATFSYRYTTPSGATEWKDGFILPGETKYLYFLGAESEQLLTSAELEFKDLAWSKVLKFDETKALKFNFSIDNINYIPPDTLTQSKASFTVRNSSAYNYRQVGFLIILERGANEVGVNYVKLNNFMAGETRDVEAVWYENIGAVQNISVLPEVNILDEGVFLEIK